MELVKALLNHPVPDRGDNIRPKHHVGVHLFTPQIEKAISKSHVLGIVGLGVDRKRQQLCCRLNLEFGNNQLHLSGIEPRVDCVGGACINPIFGPTAAGLYWSTTTGSGLTWVMSFLEGLGMVMNSPGAPEHIRAVRSAL